MRDSGLGIFCRLSGVMVAVALTGCGGGGSSPSPSGPVVSSSATPTAAPFVTPSPAPKATPTATAEPSSSSVTAKFVSGAPITVPAVGGYAAALTFYAPAGTSFPAGATVSAKSFLGLPSGAPSPQDRRRTFVATAPTVIASTEFSFSASATVLYSITATLPGATAGASYTAETFDATTGTLIATIVSEANGSGSVTFDDTVPFAVKAGDEYVTEIFATPSGGTPTSTPAATPVPTALPSVAGTSLLAANYPGGGVAEYQAASGTLVGDFATSLAVNAIGADDAGDAYTFGGNGATFEISKLAIGSSVVSATFAPTSSQPLYMSVAPAGELIVVGQTGSSVVYDEWDPGASGAPSRTITYSEPNGLELDFAQGPDGTLYVPYTTSTGVQKFDVIRADSSTLERTYTDSLSSNASPFSPNIMAAASDGTLYVGEWSFSPSDPNAGMYVFATSGAESKVASMDPGINGIDFDGSGNVYVVSDNVVFTGSGNSQSADTAEQLSVYAPHGASLTSQIDDGAPGVGSLTVGTDGTAYLVQFAAFAANGPQAAGAVYSVAPGATTSTDLIPAVDTQNVVLYASGVAKNIRTAHVFRASLTGGSNPASRARAIRRR